MSHQAAVRNGAQPRIAEPPSPADSLADARRKMAQTFRVDELVWIASEQYDDHAVAWSIDVVRQGAEGRWMRRRYRYDVMAAVLYFLGESALDPATFRALRRTATPFDVAQWQQR